MLVCDDTIVGANLAFYSSRQVSNQMVSVCNLAALCVEEEHRAHTIRLIRALLKQRNHTFTDLSPSGNVVAIDERLGFRRLDTTTFARSNLPGRTRAGVRIISDPGQIEQVLDGDDLRIYLDHRGCAAARHVVLQADDQQCYLIFRIYRRKHLRVFTSLLHVSDPEVYLRHGRSLSGFLVRRHHALVTSVERRMLLGTDRRFGSRRWVKLAGRVKMFRSGTLEQSQIDYLYSELTCVAW